MVDPFTFATSSEHNGVEGNTYGKYPVKLYNSSSVLIYQVDNGTNNIDKKPSGGVVTQSTVASSMSETVANPITYYFSTPYTVINQSGQLGDLYNYYWSSHSRGRDGVYRKGHNAHNDYLDSYIPLRHKSIYDPCPYGYRIPSNGTYNEFTTHTGWTNLSLAGGANWNNTWLSGLGNRYYFTVGAGSSGMYLISTSQSATITYPLYIGSNGGLSFEGGNSHEKDRGLSLRCIEDCSVVSDATEAVN